MRAGAVLVGGQVRAAAEEALQVAAAESRELEVQLSAAQDQLALLASDVQAKTNVSVVSIVL